MYHPDIISFFANLKTYNLKYYLHLPYIHGDEGTEQLSQLLDREVLRTDSNQMNHLIADILSNDISEDDYFRLVYLSAVSDRFTRIAANAITILNFAKVNFS